MPGTGDPEFEASAGRVRRAAPDMLAAHWRAPGFTCPNANVYPWSWLWDSCFHVLVWQALGRTDRALAELATVLSLQDPETGFVPHMGYFGDPEASVEFWGRRGASSITQPPMYGHAVAELVRDGVEVRRERLGRHVSDDDEQGARCSEVRRRPRAHDQRART